MSMQEPANHYRLGLKRGMYCDNADRPMQGSSLWQQCYILTSYIITVPSCIQTSYSKHMQITQYSLQTLKNKIHRTMRLYCMQISSLLIYCCLYDDGHTPAPRKTEVPRGILGHMLTPKKQNLDVLSTSCGHKYSQQ